MWIFCGAKILQISASSCVCFRWKSDPLGHLVTGRQLDEGNVHLVPCKGGSNPENKELSCEYVNTYGMFQYDWWSSWRIWLTKNKGSFVGEGSEKGQIPNIFNGQILDQNRQFLLASENMLLYGLGKSPAWLQEFLFPSCNFHRFACSILGKAANTCKHIPSKGWWFIVKYHPNSTSKFLTLPGYWNLISFLQPYLPRIHGFIWFPYIFPCISASSPLRHPSTRKVWNPSGPAAEMVQQKIIG